MSYTDEYIIELVSEDEAAEHNDFTLKLVQDLDASEHNPRTSTDCNLGLFVGFAHRNYEIGDEVIDGDIVEHANEAAYRFFSKGTAAERRAAWHEIIARKIKRTYGARVVVTVGLLDHSGTHYYAGGGAHWSDSRGWDSGTCGFIFDTPEQLEKTGWTGTDEELQAALVGEIKEYDAWARGEVFSYVIERDGEWVDSCSGFVGQEVAEAEAREALTWREQNSPSLAEERFAAYVEAYAG